MIFFISSTLIFCGLNNELISSWGIRLKYGLFDLLRWLSSWPFLLHFIIAPAQVWTEGLQIKGETLVCQVGITCRRAEGLSLTHFQQNIRKFTCKSVAKYSLLTGYFDCAFVKLRNKHFAGSYKPFYSLTLYLKEHFSLVYIILHLSSRTPRSISPPPNFLRSPTLITISCVSS